MRKKFMPWRIQMQIRHDDYLISDDKAQIQVERVYELLQTAYWPKNG